MSTEITDEASLKAHIASDEPVWLIKHSITCGISDAAYGEYNAYLAAHPEAKAAHILIQKQRPLSNLTAELLGRVHQSPQLFLLAKSEVLWTATHWSITAAAMDAAYQEAAA
jgi:bacillithiol system protein YtxJ